MRKRLLSTALLGLAAAVCALVYALWAGPAINGPLGLDHFDEASVRAKVTATAQRLLDESGRFDLRLSQRTDTDTLRRMQQLAGVPAATYWSRRGVPIHRWVYKVFPPRRLTATSFLKEEEPALTAEVDSSGQILALKIPPRKDAPQVKLTPDKALQTAQDGLRFIGADVARLALTSTNQGETDGHQTFDFVWKQPVDGFPGLLYQYAVTLQSGYLTGLKRDVVFAEEAPPDPMKDLVLPLLWGASWFFLALLLLLLFIQKLRRDEVDVGQGQRVALAAGALTFLRFLSNPQGSFLQTLLAAAVVSLLAALFFAFLWIVAESILRQTFGEKLRDADCLLTGQWKARETGRSVLWAGALGLVLLGVPAFLLALASGSHPLPVVLLPVDFQFSNVSFPGGLVGNALLGPLPEAGILCLIFLGVVYPLLRLRLRGTLAALFFALLFAFAITQLLLVGPPLLGLALAFLGGLLLFWVMERAGLLAGLVMLYAPLVARNVALLLSAGYAPARLQGWIALALLIALAGAAAAAALAGRPLETLKSYEPDYLLRIRERERFARELEIAKGIQDRFLPKETPSIPGFSLATRCLPAMEVGGDYYDFLPLPDGKWLLLIGDVSGKGVRAAFYMTLTKGILHAIATNEGNHSEILRRLNRIFGNLTEAGIFLTLCAVVLDPATSEVQLISAGHNPPFLLGPGGVQVLAPRGLVLGVMGDEAFLKSLKDVRMRLEPGQTLLLYTDGVTEAMDPEGREFGMERLERVLEPARAEAPNNLVEQVLAAVARFQEGAHQADDLTLLALQAHAS